MSADPFYEGDDDDYERPLDEDPTDNPPLGPDGCLFPGECCMPGPHFTSECHTAEDMERVDYLAREDEIEADLFRLMELKDNPSRALLVERITDHHYALCRAENKSKEGK